MSTLASRLTTLPTALTFDDILRPHYEGGLFGP